MQPDLFPSIDAAIDRALQEARIVGTVVLVCQDGQPVYARAAGHADREARIPMRTDHHFRLASISKLFTSTLVLVLAGQGRLGLDDPVTRWLPDFRPALPDGRIPVIRIRHLLAHRAGLGYGFDETAKDGPLQRAGVSDGLDLCDLTLQDNLARLARVPLRYPPGTNWAYSLATDVLGGVIEAVCARPLPAAMQTWLLDPLGLDDMAFHAKDPARLATAYTNDAPVPRRLRDEIIGPGDGTGAHFSPDRALTPSAFPSGGAGMCGSARDVMRLMECLRKGGEGLLPGHLIDDMGQDQTDGLSLPDMPGFGFGLGFSVLRDPALAASPESPGTWRWGGAYGHAWFVDRRRGLSVLDLSNTLPEGMNGRFVVDLRNAVYADLQN